MGLLFRAVMDKGKTFEEVMKFNPYHGKDGRFTTSGGATFVTIRTKDPSKQKWADKAMARAKEAEANGSAKRIANAEAELKGMLRSGAVVNLKGFDPEVAEETVKSVKQVLDKYPSVKDAFGGFVADDTSASTFAGKEGVMGCYDAITQKIHLNPAYFKDKSTFESKYANSVEKGYHPQGTDYRSVVTHEMGHAIDIYVSGRIDGVWGISGRYTTTATKIWNTDIDKMKKKSPDGKVTGKMIRDNLSGYASKDPAEYFAEGFAEFMCSPNPRPTAKSIGRRITNVINKASKE